MLLRTGFVRWFLEELFRSLGTNAAAKDTSGIKFPVCLLNSCFFTVLYTIAAFARCQVLFSAFLVLSCAFLVFSNAFLMLFGAFLVLFWCFSVLSGAFSVRFLLVFWS